MGSPVSALHAAVLSDIANLGTPNPSLASQERHFETSPAALFPQNITHWGADSR